VKNKTYALFVLMIVSVFYLDGCVPSKPVMQERTISPDRLIKRLEANRRKIKNFSGTGTISIKTSELDTKSNFKVEIKKPDSIKVSFYGPFGIDLASALLTPKDFLFYDVINNTVYKGKQKPGVMKEILKVNIQYDDLVDLATGSINLTDKLQSVPNATESEDDLLKLTYADSVEGKINSYLIQSDALEIRQFIQNSSNGKNLIDSKFSNFRKYDEIPIPGEINFNDIANNQKIKIEYRNIEINNEIGILKIELPSDAKIIVW
jgi:outer membrane lipoprotein-sorting protein